ncbi:hypothetical protein D9M69_672020 [compost metagenome]
MEVVVDADHDDIRGEFAQGGVNPRVVGQVHGFLSAADISQAQRHARADGDVVEGATITLTGIAEADDQDLHGWPPRRNSKRSLLPRNPRDS